MDAIGLKFYDERLCLNVILFGRLHLTAMLQPHCFQIVKNLILRQSLRNE